MDAYEILVIILSVTLAVFLILSIIAVSMILKLLSSVRKVVAKGEDLVDTATELGETLKRNAGAAGLLRVLMNFVGSMNKPKDK